MSSPKFITNKQKLLSDTMQNILPTSNKVDILVGFFYFSWFDKLYNTLKDKKIRVLVWMEIELDLKNKIKEVYKIQEDIVCDYKNDFIDQLKNTFNKTDVFDNKDTIESVNIFIQKIIDNSLEIRKTMRPNHSKLYLFHESEWSNHGGDRPWTLITWSSNFTYSGLEWRYELNARFDDKQSFLEWVEIFEELWLDSVEITTWWKDDIVVKTLTKETWLHIPTPYEAYIRVMSEYFDTKVDNFLSPEYLTDWKIKDLDYQVEAIKKWLNIISEHSWVIIADVVWLWKSIIGSTLIANLWKKALVIAPPHLKDQWENYSEDFWLNLKIFTSWKIKEAHLFNIKNEKNYDVILIDEAHRYRTSENIDYWYLQQITQWKKVILLTATPFNNSPEDIFNLIKLFQIPKKSTIQTSKLLTYEFQTLIKEYNKIRADEKEKKLSKQELKTKLNDISSKIKSLIYPVVIRRSRVDLEKREDFKKDLAKQW